MAFFKSNEKEGRSTGGGVINSGSSVQDGAFRWGELWRENGGRGQAGRWRNATWGTERERRSRPDGQTRGSLPHSRAGEDQVRVEPDKGEQTGGGGAHSDKAGHDHPFLALIPVTGATAQMNSCVPEQRKLTSTLLQNGRTSTIGYFSLRISNTSSVTGSICPENGYVIPHWKVVCFPLHAKYLAETMKSHHLTPTGSMPVNVLQTTKDSQESTDCLQQSGSWQQDNQLRTYRNSLIRSANFGKFGLHGADKSVWSFSKAYIDKYGKTRGWAPYDEYDEVISRVKRAKYFSVSVDSIPDVRHMERMSHQRAL